MAPIFWISGREFDALQDPIKSEVGDATGRTKDVVGNNMTSFGTIKLKADEAKGYAAYHFDKSNSIKSETSVNNSFTFIAIYKRLEPTAAQGRFFTSDSNNRYFASWSQYADQWYSNEWISNVGHQPADAAIEFNLGTVNNGLKTMYDFRRETMPTGNSAGDNEWGRVLIGKPLEVSDQAASVYVYEALVFDRVLNAAEIQTVKKIYRDIYFKAGTFRSTSLPFSSLFLSTKCPFISTIITSQCFSYCLNLLFYIYTLIPIFDFNFNIFCAKHSRILTLKVKKNHLRLHILSIILSLFYNSNIKSI